MALSHSPSIVTAGLTSCLDAGNPRSFSPNTFPIPLDIFGWSGAAANAATLSRDPTTSPSPAGGIPMKMAISGDDPHTGTTNSSIWNVSTAANGQTWTLSVYVKGAVATTGEIFIFGADASGSWTTLSNYGAGGITITTDWTRVSYSFTFSNANVAFIQFRLDGTPTGGAGTNIWWDGIQVQQLSSTTTFNPSYNLNRSVFKDASGNVNTGTLLNGTVYANTNGGALSFDGVDDYVAQSTFDMTSLSTQQITLEAWVKHTNLTGSQAYINNWYNFTGGDQRGVILRTYNGQAYPSFWWCWGADYNAVYASSFTMSPETWYHVVGTFSQTVAARIYINGELSNSTTDTSVNNALVYDATNKFNLGRSPINGSWMNGQIAQAKVYTTALSATQIAQNFNATRGRYGV